MSGYTVSKAFIAAMAGTAVVSGIITHIEMGYQARVNGRVANGPGIVSSSCGITLTDARIIPNGLEK